MHLHAKDMTALSRLKVTNSSWAKSGLSLIRGRPRISRYGLGMAMLSHPRRSFLLSSRPTKTPLSKRLSLIFTSMLFALWLYPSDSHHHCHSLAHLNDGRHHTSSFHDRPSREYSPKEDEENEAAWSRFVHSISNTTFIPSADALSDKVIDMLMPEWTKLIPGYIRKLQRELSPRASSAHHFCSSRRRPRQ